MNITIFWILFLSLWAIVPLMIIKGRKETTVVKAVSLKDQTPKKGWFR